VAVQEVKAEQGTANQLPQGEATALNEAMPAELAPEELAAAPEGGQAAEDDTSEPLAAEPSDYEPIYTPETDDEQFLVGPTTRPDEPVTTGAFAGAPASLPPDAAAWMPVFAQAAMLPDAPPQLKTLVRLLSDAAES
jgi:hypothetical protein